MRRPRSGGVYALVCRPTGRAYVGSSTDVERRRLNHFNLLRRGRHHTPELQRHWNEHDERAFEWRLLEEVADASLLPEREAAWAGMIAAYAGRKPWRRSPEGNRKAAEAISKAQRGRKLPAEWRANLSAGKRGKAATLTEADRARLRAWAKRPRTPEWRARIAIAMKGLRRPPFAPEHRAKLSASATGRKDTPQTRANKRAAALKWWAERKRGKR